MLIVSLGLSAALSNQSFCKDRDVQYCKELLAAIENNNFKKVELLWRNEVHGSLNETQKNFIKRTALANLDIYKKKNERIYRNVNDIAKLTLGTALACCGVLMNVRTVTIPMSTKLVHEKYLAPARSDASNNSQNNQSMSKNNGNSIERASDSDNLLTLSYNFEFDAKQTTNVNSNSDVQNKYIDHVYASPCYGPQNYLTFFLGTGVIGLGLKLMKSGWGLTSAQQALKNAQLIFDIIQS